MQASELSPELWAQIKELVRAEVQAELRTPQAAVATLELLREGLKHEAEVQS